MAATATLLVVGAVRCRQVLGIEERHEAPVPDAAGPACSAFHAQATSCASCTTAICCAETAACRADPVCAAAFDCLAGCAGSDVACRAACSTLATEAVSDLAACQATSCAIECGLTCGGAVELYAKSVITGSSACRTCATTVGCAATTTCAQSKDCLRLLGCENACAPLDSTCAFNCGGKHPGGVAVLADRGWLSSCDSDCRPAPDWSCVGHVEWPSATESPITYRLGIFDFIDKSPLNGVHVKACPAGSVDCVPNLVMQDTDATGTVSLTLNVVGSFDGYFDISGVDSRGDALYPQLYTLEPYPATTVNANNPSVEFTQLPTNKSLLGILSLGLEAGAIDLTAGLLLVFEKDCTGRWSPGVSFTVSPMTATAVPFYFRGIVPDPNASATDNGVYPAFGVMGLGQGAVTITATVAGVGQVAKTTVVIRNGALTDIEMAPTP